MFLYDDGWWEATIEESFKHGRRSVNKTLNFYVSNEWNTLEYNIYKKYIHFYSQNKVANIIFETVANFILFFIIFIKLCYFSVSQYILVAYKNRTHTHIVCLHIKAID